MTATERLSLIMTDLLAVLKSQPTPSPIYNSKQELATAITTLQLINLQFQHQNQVVHGVFLYSMTPTLDLRN